MINQKNEIQQNPPTCDNEFWLDSDRFVYRYLSYLMNKYSIDKAMSSVVLLVIVHQDKYCFVNDQYQSKNHHH